MPPQDSTYIVGVTAVLSNKEELKYVFTEVTLPTSGYVVLPVEAITRTLVSLGKKKNGGEVLAHFAC